MRIGCLQFAPQKTEIDHNLNRADEVLRKANEQKLDNLDLLVVPELAITGSNYRSLQEIDPYLEPGTSSTTSLWARTKALRYNCHVCVGYPERRDITSHWPTGPEYYNSVVLVNENGENTCNYRKCNLEPVEQAWALEGPEGFHDQWVDGLGNITIGISDDLNKHYFDEHGNKIFEFAEHAAQSGSKLVIINMAWLTRKNPRTYRQTPAEPDWDVLEHWIHRLQPLYEKSKGSKDEITVVFCNRIGSESGPNWSDETIYTGTSTVIGFQNGEILLYGALGRGEKNVLCIDTSIPPRHKLEIHWPTMINTRPVREPSPPPHLQMHSARGRPTAAARQSLSNQESRFSSTPPPPPATWTLSMAFSDFIRESNRKREESMRPASRGLSIDTGRQANDDDGVLPTPSAPSPTPICLRPKLLIPDTSARKAEIVEFNEPTSAMSYHSQTSEYSIKSYTSVLSSASVLSQATVRSLMRPPGDSTPYPWTGVSGNTPARGPKTPEAFPWPPVGDRLSDGKDRESIIGSFLYDLPDDTEQQIADGAEWTPIQDTAHNDDEGHFPDPVLAFTQRTSHLLPTADAAERIREIGASESPVPNRPESPKSRNTSRSRAGYTPDIRRRETPSIEKQRDHHKDAADIPTFASPGVVGRDPVQRGRQADIRASSSGPPAQTTVRAGSVPAKANTSAPRSGSNRPAPRAGSQYARRPSASRQRSSSLHMRDFIMIESKPGSSCPLHAPWIRSNSVSDLSSQNRSSGSSGSSGSPRFFTSGKTSSTSRSDSAMEIRAPKEKQARRRSMADLQGYAPDVKSRGVVRHLVTSEAVFG